MIQQRIAGSRVLLDPSPDRLGRYLIGRIGALSHQFLPDRPVRMAILAAISHAHHMTIRHPNAARALNLQEKRIDWVFQPRDLQAAPAQRARLDVGARVVDRAILQFRRAGIDRNAEPPGLAGRAVELWLIVAGEQRRGIADQNGPEEQLEIRARAFGAGGCVEGQGT